MTERSNGISPRAGTVVGFSMVVLGLMVAIAVVLGVLSGLTGRMADGSLAHKTTQMAQVHVGA